MARSKTSTLFILLGLVISIILSMQFVPFALTKLEVHSPDFIRKNMDGVSWRSSHFTSPSVACPDPPISSLKEMNDILQDSGLHVYVITLDESPTPPVKFTPVRCDAAEASRHISLGSVEVKRYLCAHYKAAKIAVESKAALSLVLEEGSQLVPHFWTELAYRIRAVQKEGDDFGIIWLYYRMTNPSYQTDGTIFIKNAKNQPILRKYNAIELPGLHAGQYDEKKNKGWVPATIAYVLTAKASKDIVSKPMKGWDGGNAAWFTVSSANKFGGYFSWPPLIYTCPRGQSLLEETHRTRDAFNELVSVPLIAPDWMAKICLAASHLSDPNKRKVVTYLPLFGAYPPKDPSYSTNSSFADRFYGARLKVKVREKSVESVPKWRPKREEYNIPINEEVDTYLRDMMSSRNCDGKVRSISSLDSVGIGDVLLESIKGLEYSLSDNELYQFSSFDIEGCNQGLGCLFYPPSSCDASGPLPSPLSSRDSIFNPPSIFRRAASPQIWEKFESKKSLLKSEIGLLAYDIRVWNGHLMAWLFQPLPKVWDKMMKQFKGLLFYQKHLAEGKGCSAIYFHVDGPDYVLDESLLKAAWQLHASSGIPCLLALTNDHHVLKAKLEQYWRAHPQYLNDPTKKFTSKWTVYYVNEGPRTPVEATMLTLWAMTQVEFLTCSGSASLCVAGSTLAWYMNPNINAYLSGRSSLESQLQQITQIDKAEEGRERAKREPITLRVSKKQRKTKEAKQQKVVKSNEKREMKSKAMKEKVKGNRKEIRSKRSKAMKDLTKAMKDRKRGKKKEWKAIEKDGKEGIKEE